MESLKHCPFTGKSCNANCALAVTTNEDETICAFAGIYQETQQRNVDAHNTDISEDVQNIETDLDNIHRNFHNDLSSIGKALGVIGNNV